jgi:hypothetical protein
MYSIRSNFAALKKRGMDHVAVLHFAHHFEIRKLAFYRSDPIYPERIGHVLPGVHANSVDTSGGDPPQRVLNQVPGNLRVVLVEIGQEVEKPPLHRLAFKAPNWSRVMKHPRLKDVLQVAIFGSIEPRGRGRIFDPWMVWTSVVHYLVLNDLYAGLMRGRDQFTHFCVRAEVLVDSIKVLWVVAVKSGARFTFLQLDLVESILIVVPRS